MTENREQRTEGLSAVELFLTSDFCLLSSLITSTDDRRQMTDDKEQMTDDREQKTDDRSQGTE
jgi:hypothetical protein